MKKNVLIFGMAAVLSASLLTGCGSLGKKETKQDTKQEETTAQDTSAAQEETKNKEAEAPAQNQEESDFVETKQVEESGTASVVTELDTSKELSGKHHVEIDIQGMGTISAELDADSAPITVTNFVKLVQEDFYDGLTFHRIIDGFMMQGGDPLGNGTGGAKMNIKGEFAENGVDNKLSHARGALSMARAAAPDSASSQFFIVQTDSHYLDGKYAVFGYVTEGMDIVDEICKAAEPIDGNGLVEKSAQPVMTDIRILD